MDLSPLYASLKKEEGVVKIAYQDSLGIWTIGVGFNIDGKHGGGLDDEEINFILEHRVSKASQLAAAYPWYDSLSDPRKLVVVDMVYNMGNTTFSQFHGTHHSIATEDYTGAAQGMLNSRWATQVGNRAIRLARIMESGTWEM